MIDIHRFRASRKFSALRLIHGQQRFIRHSAVFRILLFEQLISVFGAFGRLAVAEYFHITCDSHFVMWQQRCHAGFRYTRENRMHSGELCGAVGFADKPFSKLGSDLEPQRVGDYDENSAAAGNYRLNSILVEISLRGYTVKGETVPDVFLYQTAPASVQFRAENRRVTLAELRGRYCALHPKALP